MYIYHALTNALTAHMIHINLNMIFCTYVEHSPTKTIYIKYYLKKIYIYIKRTTNTHTHTLTVITSIELYMFMPVLVTLIRFQAHSVTRKLKLKAVFHKFLYSQVQIMCEYKMWTGAYHDASSNFKNKFRRHSSHVPLVHKTCYLVFLVVAV